MPVSLLILVWDLLSTGIMKTTKDWLVKAPMLATYGTGAPFINGGDIENKEDTKLL